jgi:rRNA maturation RNase YbeY
LFGKRWPLRWFSSVQPGEIEVFNEQTALKNINQEEIKHTISKIRSLLGYETYAVSLVLVDDDDMQETNKETRGVDAPTDVLSFPMHDAVEPGVLEKPEFDIPDYYNLGDMMIDVPYVIRQCKDDEEWEYEDEDDRGVSAAMVNVFDPEKRIHMLLVHGMLHLVGYDHIDDADYELMVTKEDELLKALNLPLAIKKEN